MLLVTEMPLPVVRYHEIGGALDFAFFADTDGDVKDLQAAIAQAIERGTNGWVGQPRHVVDRAQLSMLTSREMGQAEFLGSKVDARTGDLLYNGQCRLTNGQTLVDPTYRRLATLLREGVTIVSSARVGSAGATFGEAFTSQPHPLLGDPERIHKAFESVRALTLPPGKRCRILDWSGPQLRSLSKYFLGEHAYWGEYLFTVHVRADRWLAVISGSASD